MAIYLDYNATTPVADEVLRDMLPWFSERFWNPASAHAAGEASRQAVEKARAATAALIGARARELVFTSGSTEANNLALKGALEGSLSGRDTVLVGATEHKAILDTATWAAERGYHLVQLPVDWKGTIDLQALSGELTERVAIVSIMLANNETGVVQPVRAVADLVHEAGGLLHTDATQAVGKVPVDVGGLDVDLLSLSAHKFYGPKGIGALYVRRGTVLKAQQHGGGHESGLRSGTLNVPGIVGMGAASELARSSLECDVNHGRALINQLVDGLRSRLSGVEWVGESSERLPNTAAIRFVGADAEAVMANAPHVMVSSGSACTARVPEPSHVLLAMGLGQEEAYESLRFSVGRRTTSNEIAQAVDEIALAVERVRSLNSTNAATVAEGVVH